MADYYQHVSLAFTCKPEEVDWLQQRFNELKDAEDDVERLYGLQMRVLAKDGGSDVWISDREDGNPNLEALADFLWEYVQKFDTEPIYFEYANSASKPLLDAYGGGACVVTKDSVSWMNTGMWAQAELNAYKQKKEGS